MAITAPIQINDEASPQLLRMAAALSNKRPMLRAVGNRVRNTVRDHLIKRSLGRRNKFGAPSSGFWGQAAEKTARAPLTTDAESVTISLNHPGIARAFRDVTITPGAGKKYLTIPIIATAYNKRARRIPGLFPMFKAGAQKGVLAKRTKDGKVVPYFALVPSVFQRRDRSILPGDAEIEASAVQGIGDYFALLLQAQRGGAA